MKKRQVFIQLDEESDEDTQQNPQQEQYLNNMSGSRSSTHSNHSTGNNNLNNNNEQEYQEEQQQDTRRLSNNKITDYVASQNHQTQRDNEEDKYEEEQKSISIMDQSLGTHYNNTDTDHNNDKYSTNGYKNQYQNSNLQQIDLNSDGGAGLLSSHNTRNNFEITPDQSQLQYSQNAVQEDQLPCDNTEYQTMEEQNNQDQETLERIIQQVIERQENIVYAIGEEAQFPVIDSQISTLPELCQEMNTQMQFLFEYYEDLRKNNAQKFSSNNAQRQLIREKENLNTQLKQQTDENKDLQVKIKQYNQEIEDLQKRINHNNFENMERLSLVKQSSSQKQPAHLANAANSQNRQTPKNIVKQFINLDGSPTHNTENNSSPNTNNQQNAVFTFTNDSIKQNDFQDKDEKIKTQSDTISLLEKELQELKDQKAQFESNNPQGSSSTQQQKSLIKNKSRENFKSKYYQLSLSNIEESDHESSFTKQDFTLTRKIEEKDLIIANLQDKIKSLMQASQLQLNVFNHEGIINGLGQGIGSSGDYFNIQGNQNNNSLFDIGGRTPSKNNSFIYLAGGNGSSTNLPTKQKTSFKQLEGSTKDLIQRSISQAQTIEDILKNQKQNDQKITTKISDKYNYEELIDKMDTLNRKYHEMVKDYKELAKEKKILMKIMEELGQTNQVLDTDFKILFKQVQVMNDKRVKEEQKLERERFVYKVSDYIPKHEIEDIDSLFEYIDILFKEKNYVQAGNMWQKISYEELIGVKQEAQMDYLRALLVIKDKQIQESNGSINDQRDSRSRSPEKKRQQAEQHKLNEIAQNHLNQRHSRITKLQTQLTTFEAKNSQLQEVVTQLKNKIELLNGEKDFDKRKNEKLKKEVDQAMNELKTFKEQKLVEVQEKYEKQIGQMKEEIRQYQKQVKSGKNRQNQESPVKKYQEVDSDEEQISPIINKQQQIDPVRFTSGSKKDSHKSSQQNILPPHLSKLPSSTSSTSEKDLETVLRKLYSQFFTNEYKSSQDKIRNKNSVFKELFEITINDIIKSRDTHKDIKKKYRQMHLEHDKIKEENKEHIRVIERSHSYSIKLIKRLSNDSNAQELIEDVEKLNLKQLLKLISQLIQDFEEKQSKLQKYKQSMSIDNGIDTVTTKNSRNDFMKQLSREDALEMLKQLSDENEQLIISSDNFSKELQKIAKEVRILQKSNDELEKENSKLKKYCRIMKEKRQSRDFNTQNTNTPQNQSHTNNSSRIQYNHSNYAEYQLEDRSHGDISSSMMLQEKEMERIESRRQSGKQTINTSSNLGGHQFRTLDSRSSVESEKINIQNSKTQKISSTIIKQDNPDYRTNQNFVPKKFNIDNSKKPPREPNISLFTQSQPKSINPNKKYLEQTQQPTYGLKSRPSQPVHHKQTNSFQNMQKELSNISARDSDHLILKSNYNSYTNCYTSPKTQVLPQHTMTPTNKFSDYFSNAVEAAADKRLNQNSHQNLHEPFNAAQNIIDSHHEDQITSLRNTTAPSPVTSAKYENDYYGSTHNASKIEPFRDSQLIQNTLNYKPISYRDQTSVSGTVTYRADNQDQYYTQKQTHLSVTPAYNLTNRYGISEVPKPQYHSTTTHNSSIESGNKHNLTASTIPVSNLKSYENSHNNQFITTQNSHRANFEVRSMGGTNLSNTFQIANSQVTKKIVALRHHTPINSLTNNGGIKNEVINDSIRNKSYL
eukprot:403339519